MIGETTSHYRVLERLGRGGMGDVYLAEDLRLHRRVALKMLRPEAQGGEEAQARLLREARAASALNHPNIAVVYEIDAVDQGDGPVGFIAMEYVAGRTLVELGRAGGLELERILAIGRQVAEALGEAHERGIVHRDVKPSNVMVTESGRVKLLDFGLARQRVLPDDSSSTWTRAAGADAGALVGTLAYMAPEQARDEPIDGRADVFSLGALLYELLAGRPPFAGRNAVELLDGLLNREPPPVTSRGDDPGARALEAVVRRMLAKDREKRYASMAEVVEELRALQRGEAPRALPPAPAGPPSIAVLSFVNITGNGEDDWLGTGIAETVTADLRSALGLCLVGRERVNETLRKLGVEAPTGDEALARRVGRELGARYVLSGGFQRAGEAVRVTARLDDVAADTNVRTAKIDGRLDRIFELQDGIVRELGRDLRPDQDAQARGADSDETHVIEAFEAFSKGVLNLRAESYESLDRAVFLFERAIALDPGYAQAHLELGAAYASMADHLSLTELHEVAVESYRRALALRSGLVRGWRALGSSLVALGKDDEGIAAIRRGLELDGEDAGALGAMGRALFIGRADFAGAAGYFEQALRRNPQGGWYALQLAHCRALLRDFGAGEAAAKRAAALQEEWYSGQEGVQIVGAHMRLGHLAALQGRQAEAVEHLEREAAFVERAEHALRGRIGIELNMRLGAAQQQLGQPERAQAAFARALDAFERRVRLGADDPFTRYYAAGVLALRGDAAEALASLERAAARQRAFTLARARIEPEWQALRADPRFRAIVA